MGKCEVMLEDCMSCGAKCCHHVSIYIDKPTCKRDYDNIRWYLMHENVNVYVDHEGDWLVEFETVCSHLNENNTCDIYSRRPNVCRDYPAAGMECEYFASEAPYRVMFSTSEEFERYLDKKGIDWRYKKHEF